MADPILLTPDLEEQLKKQAPKLEGLEFEKVLGPRDESHLSKETLIFVPLSKETDLAPAAPYLDSVKAIAKPGIADKHLLLASIAKMGEHFKTKVVFDFQPYTNAGVNEELEKHKDELLQLGQVIEQLKNKDPAAYKQGAIAYQQRIAEITQPIIRDNVNANEAALEELVKSADAAFAETRKTKAITTPDYILDLADKSQNTDSLYPDDNGDFMKGTQALGQFVEAHGSNRDKKYHATGQRIYVAHTKREQIKQDGNPVLDKNTKQPLIADIITHVEVYRKKAA